MTRDPQPTTQQRMNRIGFSQRIRLEWLEKTANLVLAGNDEASIYAALQELLEDKLSVDRSGHEPNAEHHTSPKRSIDSEVLLIHEARRRMQRRIRGNREKAITILMRIWVRPPHNLYPLKQDGLKLLSVLPRENHIAVHWGMATAVYPFWGAVAAHVGRLLRLQGVASHAQVRRRIMEHYGQRPTVKDAVRRVLRSMRDWSVLQDAPTHDARRSDGTYVPGLSLAITHVELIAWLTEAYLNAHLNGSAALKTILKSRLFPFHLSPIPADHLVLASERLDVLRHGLDQDLIMLKSS